MPDPQKPTTSTTSSISAEKALQALNLTDDDDLPLDAFEDELIKQTSLAKDMGFERAKLFFKGMTIQESGGKETAVSPKAARGKYQVTDALAKGKYSLDNTNPALNRYMGIHYWDEGYEKAKEFSKDPVVLAAVATSYFHGGDGALNKIRKSGGTFSDVSDGGTTTNDHVFLVLSNWKKGIEDAGLNFDIEAPELPVSYEPKEIFTEGSTNYFTGKLENSSGTPGKVAPDARSRAEILKVKLSPEEQAQFATASPERRKEMFMGMIADHLGGDRAKAIEALHYLDDYGNNDPGWRQTMSDITSVGAMGEVQLDSAIRSLVGAYQTGGLNAMADEMRQVQIERGQYVKEEEDAKAARQREIDNLRQTMKPAEDASAYPLYDPETGMNLDYTGAVGTATLSSAKSAALGAAGGASGLLSSVTSRLGMDSWDKSLTDYYSHTREGQRVIAEELDLIQNKRSIPGVVMSGAKLAGGLPIIVGAAATGGPGAVYLTALSQSAGEEPFKAIINAQLTAALIGLSPGTGLKDVAMAGARDTLANALQLSPDFAQVAALKIYAKQHPNSVSAEELSAADKRLTELTNDLLANLAVGAGLAELSALGSRGKSYADTDRVRFSRLEGPLKLKGTDQTPASSSGVTPAYSWMLLRNESTGKYERVSAEEFYARTDKSKEQISTDNIRAGAITSIASHISNDKPLTDLDGNPLGRVLTGVIAAQDAGQTYHVATFTDPQGRVLPSEIVTQEDAEVLLARLQQVGELKARGASQADINTAIVEAQPTKEMLGEGRVEALLAREKAEEPPRGLAYRDEIYLPRDEGSITIYKNPDKDTQARINKLYRRESPGARGEEQSRSLYDAEGNEYRWVASDGLHSDIEPALSNELGVLLSKDKAIAADTEAAQSQPPLSTDPNARHPKLFYGEINERAQPGDYLYDRVTKEHRMVTATDVKKFQQRAALKEHKKFADESDFITQHRIAVKDSATGQQANVAANIISQAIVLGYDTYRAVKEAGQGFTEWLEKMKTGVDKTAHPYLPDIYEKMLFLDGTHVKDENGPIKVYHGTQGGFEEFNTVASGREPGTHFGTHKAANEFTRRYDTKELVPGSNIRPVYLNIKNPIEIRDVFGRGPERLAQALFEAGIYSEQEVNALRERVSADVASEPAMREIVNSLKTKGYDGFKYINRAEDSGSTSWVVFSPDQILSAFEGWTPRHELTGESFNPQTSAFTQGLKEFISDETGSLNLDVVLDGLSLGIDKLSEGIKNLHRFVAKRGRGIQSTIDPQLSEIIQALPPQQRKRVAQSLSLSDRKTLWEHEADALRTEYLTATSARKAQISRELTDLSDRIVGVTKLIVKHGADTSQGDAVASEWVSRLSAGARSKASLLDFAQRAKPLLEALGTNLNEYFLYRQQDSLEGARERYNFIARLIPMMGDDDLIMGFINKGGLNFNSIVKAINAVQPGKYDEASVLYTNLQKAAESGDFTVIRKQLENLFTVAAMNVPHDVLPDYTNYRANGRLDQVNALYKTTIHDLLQEKFAETDSRGTQFLGADGLYFPLLAEEPSTSALKKKFFQPFRKLQYEKGRSPAARFKTGLSDKYTLDMQRLQETFAKQIRAGDRAGMIQTLLDSGLAREHQLVPDPNNPGKWIPDEISEGMTSREIGPARVFSSKRKITNQSTGEVIEFAKEFSQPVERIVLSEQLARDVDPLIDPKLGELSERDLNKALGAITNWTIIGPLDLAFHSWNVLDGLRSRMFFMPSDIFSASSASGRAMAYTLNKAMDGAGHLGVLPFVGTPLRMAYNFAHTLGQNLFSKDQLRRDRAWKNLEYLLQSGALPERTGHTTYSPAIANALGADLVGPAQWKPVRAMLRAMGQDVPEPIAPGRFKPDSWADRNITGTKLERPVLFVKKVGKTVSTSPLIFGWGGLDTRARLAAAEALQHYLPSLSPYDTFEAISVMGVYNRFAESQLGNALKQSHIAPFYSAASARVRRVMQAWTSPMYGAQSQLIRNGEEDLNKLPAWKRASIKTAAMLSESMYSQIAAWAIAYHAYNGVFPWQDEDSRFMQMRLKKEDIESSRFLSTVIPHLAADPNKDVYFAFNPFFGGTGGGSLFGINSAWKFLMATTPTEEGFPSTRERASGAAASALAQSLTNFAHVGISGPAPHIIPKALTGMDVGLMYRPRPAALGGGFEFSIPQSRGPVGETWTRQLAGAVLESNSFLDNIFEWGDASPNSFAQYHNPMLSNMAKFAVQLATRNLIRAQEDPKLTRERYLDAIEQGREKMETLPGRALQKK